MFLCSDLIGDIIKYVGRNYMGVHMDEIDNDGLSLNVSNSVVTYLIANPHKIRFDYFVRNSNDIAVDYCINNIKNTLPAMRLFDILPNKIAKQIFKYTKDFIPDSILKNDNDKMATFVLTYYPYDIQSCEVSDNANDVWVDYILTKELEWTQLSYNSNPRICDLLLSNLDKISYYGLSSNTNDKIVQYLISNPSKIEQFNFANNPNELAVDYILSTNHNKNINTSRACSNSNVRLTSITKQRWVRTEPIGIIYFVANTNEELIPDIVSVYKKYIPLYTSFKLMPTFTHESNRLECIIENIYANKILFIDIEQIKKELLK